MRVGIIGLGMVGFLFQDAASSLFRGGGDTNVGEIGNVAISARDFDRKLNEFISRYEYQNGPADAQVRESIKEQVWNDIVREELLVKQFNLVGLTVSPKELDDMINEILDEHDKIHKAVSRISEGNLEQNLDEFGLLLESHIRKEERILFPKIEEILGDELDILDGQIIAVKDSCGI